RIEHRVLPYCQEQGIALVGYSPFGSGNFVAPQSRGGALLAEIAESHGATPQQVALAFLCRQEHLFTIPKAPQVAHVRDNGPAGALQLTAQDIARIDATFPRGRNRSGVPTL